ncbi:MAG: PEP-utilizing enzyme [Parcubacteria group bacterium]
METYGVAQLFTRASRNEEISPALYNGAMIVQSSGWNTRKYFKKYYDDDLSFPLVVTMNSKEGIYYYHFSQAQRHSEEIFLRHWKGQDILDQRFKIFHRLDDKISEIYEKLTYHYIALKQESEIKDDVIAIRDAVWDMNAALFFSIAFDERMCLGFLKQVKSDINPDRVRSLWENATWPVSHSFDIRRRHILINMIKEGCSWEKIGEKCQFFEAHYDHIKSASEVASNLKKDFGDFSLAQIDDILRRDIDAEKERRQEYARWIRTLSSEEIKLVEYIQAIMKLRDVRKDSMARFTTVTYRFAQKIFAQCAVGEKYIPYTHFHEVLKGSEYISSISHIVQARFPEYSVFIDKGGKMIENIGKHEDVKKQINDYYLQQQSLEKYGGNIIKGSVGSPGKVQGRVRVIHSYRAQRNYFLKNEILVTGMTRPEFVSLMKKASAIITDEGGITSHAAIISRELKIPCIIGTKIATQILHDGDLVEVDADMGIVRILNKS